MIKDFYITAKDIKDPKDKDMSLYSCKLTEEMLDGTSTVIEVIKKIETFNDSKPRNKRMMYSVLVEGFATPIHVAKAKFLEGDSVVILYTYNSNGNVYITTTTDKESKLIDGISTFMINVDKITGVNFGSFSRIDCDFLIRKEETMTEEKMLSLLNEELAIWNSSVAAGEYRQAINHFCLFMKNNKVNEFEFDYNNAAFNKYIMLCGAYMNLIKDIVGRHDDPTINVLNPRIPNKVYFFKNEEKRDEFIKQIDNHPRMNVTINNTFYDSDITIFKQILSKD